MLTIKFLTRWHQVKLHLEKVATGGPPKLTSFSLFICYYSELSDLIGYNSTILCLVALNHQLTQHMMAIQPEYITLRDYKTEVW